MRTVRAIPQNYGPPPSQEEDTQSLLQVTNEDSILTSYSTK